MQVDALTRFVDGLNHDAALSEAFAARFGTAAQEVAATQVMEFACEHGYAFDVEQGDVELPDDQLESVAGGGVIIVESAPLRGRSQLPAVQVSYAPSTATFSFRSMAS